MPNNQSFTALAVALCLVAGHASAQEEAARISRSQIDAMFANMKAHAPWNLDSNLLWGYYFTARDKGPLEDAAKDLVAQGYRLVDIHSLGQAAGTRIEGWQLHVERVEHHTPQSLFTRNDQLYDFAKKHRLATYDGMDVGPVEHRTGQ